MKPTVHVTIIDYVIIIAYLVFALVMGVVLGSGLPKAWRSTSLRGAPCLGGWRVPAW